MRCGGLLISCGRPQQRGDFHRHPRPDRRAHPDGTGSNRMRCNPLADGLSRSHSDLRSSLPPVDSVAGSPAAVSLPGQREPHRWTDAFGQRITRWHRPTCCTCSDQARRHWVARRGTTQHDPSRSRNAQVAGSNPASGSLRNPRSDSFSWGSFWRYAGTLARAPREPGHTAATCEVSAGRSATVCAFRCCRCCESSTTS